MEDAFAAFRTEIEKEYELKEEIRGAVRETEAIMREAQGSLGKIHADPNPAAIAAIAAATRAAIAGDIRAGLAKLAALLPEGQFWKYHDLFRWPLQRAVVLTLQVEWLETEKLATLSETQAALGLPSGELRVDVDDYLHGVLDLARELSRLAVNAVTAGDFKRPRVVRALLSDVDAGFRSLNLKNDSLRRRFDALKYDLKKVEEVVYDLSIRNLLPDGKGTSNVLPVPGEKEGSSPTDPAV